MIRKKYTHFVHIIYPLGEQREGVWRQRFGKTEVELGMVWLQVHISKMHFYMVVLLQGVVETLDRENDWLEMSEEGARVNTFYI